MKHTSDLLKIIRSALVEDIGKGDITTKAIIPAGKNIQAKIITKEKGIIAGLEAAEKVFKAVSRKIRFTKKVKDGIRVNSGKVIAIVKGPAQGILTAERTALNFLQRFSGIATLTNRFVNAAGNKVKVLDTRKTTPGLRMHEKYSVKCGGGVNHRFGLYDAVLIKDNHLAIVGGLGKAVRSARKKYNKVEVETKTIGQVKQAIESGVTRVMLDNMSVAVMKKAVKLIRKAKRRIEIEASGEINIRNVSKIAKTGVDFISIGALTHSAKALDISLDLVK